ncbi:MAG: class I SAM-dependent methyltransferase [Deltaproteobacteria bacterium]|nr:class I SAM-dependent methyltransferase [Deltaproteobacteria bacterium]
MPPSARLAALEDHLLAWRPRLAARAADEPSRQSTCVRLSAGSVDGLPGLLVDQFGPLVVGTEYCGPDEGAATADALLGVLTRCFPQSHVVAKARAAVDGKNVFVSQAARPAAPQQVPLVARECGLAYEVGLDPAHDFGIYLDAAKARQYVRGVAQGKRVLNLFSYTGAFGIAAAAGGAADVANVDPNREYLAWSLRNAALNQVKMRVLPDTTQDFLAKHLRRVERKTAQAFDVVIVDPPAFGVGRGNERLLRLLWPQIFASLRVMVPEHVVLLCNDKYFRTRTAFVALVEQELGASYSFTPLGTTLEREQMQNCVYVPTVSDPFYSEPTVLAGVRR